MPRHEGQEPELAASEQAVSVRPIQARRVILREFAEHDRSDFIRYQTDERYRRLYDFDSDLSRPNLLFDQFLTWRFETPRTNFQLGLFDAATADLLGCGGVREVAQGTGTLGLELAPDQWGRFRLAVDATVALLTLGFEVLQLETITGDTGTGNRRVEKLAQWFGAELINTREGPAWMQARGWREADWAINRDRWRQMQEASSRTAG